MWIENVDTEESDLDIDGLCVDVHRNLQHECLTITSRDTADDTPEYGTKIGEADMVLIDEPSFVVQESGQEKVREEERKNVHAFVRGTVEAVDLDAEIEWNLMARMFSNDLCNVNYDPYEMDGFEVVDVVRMEQWNYDVGDVVEEAMTGCVTTGGIGTVFPDREAVEG